MGKWYKWAFSISFNFYWYSAKQMGWNINGHFSSGFVFLVNFIFTDVGLVDCASCDWQESKITHLTFHKWIFYKCFVPLLKKCKHRCMPESALKNCRLGVNVKSKTTKVSTSENSHRWSLLWWMILCFKEWICTLMFRNDGQYVLSVCIVDIICWLWCFLSCHMIGADGCM